MRTATVLLLVVLSQTLSPASRSEQQEPANTKNEKTSTPPPSVPVINNQNRTKEQKDVAKAETEQRPQIPPPWDVAWATWGLVFVGLLAAIIALCTLSDIRKQTINATKAARAAQTSAKAALLNARAVIEAERGRIFCNISPEKLSPMFQDRAETTYVRCELHYRNEGRSICWVLSKSIWFAIVEEIPTTPRFDLPIAQEFDLSDVPETLPLLVRPSAVTQIRPCKVT